MSEQAYAVARAKAGRYMGDAYADPYYLGYGIPSNLPASPTCVYVTTLDDSRCAYVGKTRQGVSARLAQHVRRWERASRWRWVWVIPVLDGVPDRELGRIEGRVGRLLKPIDTLRLPKRH